MTEIAGYVGRAACAAIGSFVSQCHTGESLRSLAMAQPRSSFSAAF
jgi:hypothetical protein